MRLIITCGCSDTSQFAKDAFKILFKDGPMPKVIEESADTPYALLLDIKRYNDGMKLEVYDLMKGKRLC